MKLNRVIPAFLALSLLTGCDINGLMAGFKTDGKNGKGGEIVDENKDTPKATWESLSEEEKAVINDYTELVFEAAGQGLAAAGTFDALKSVSALTSNSAYRISSAGPTVDLSKLPGLPFTAENSGPGGGKAWKSFDPAYKSANGKFDGKMGELVDGGTAWYLDGRFTPVQDFVAEGQAVFKVSSGTLDLSQIQNFQAEAEIDAKIKGVPIALELVALINEPRIKLNLKKTEATSTILDGTFKLSRHEYVISEGEITFDLKDDTWSVLIPIDGSRWERLFVSLKTQRNGAGQADIYEETEGKADYEKKRARFVWDKDGKLLVTDVHLKPVSLPKLLPPMSFSGIVTGAGN